MMAALKSKGSRGKKTIYVPTLIKVLEETEDGIKSLKEEVDHLHSSPAKMSATCFALLLRKCIEENDVVQGKRVHALLCKFKEQADTYVGNLVIQMYGSFGLVQDALAAFESIKMHNVYSWNILFAAYARNGHLQDAESTFDKMPGRDVVSWNGMIAAYAQARQVEDTLNLFKKMEIEKIEPSKVTFITILDALGSPEFLASCKFLHAKVALCGFHSDVRIETTLLSIYGKCGVVENARLLFENMVSKDAVAWNAMVAAYANNGFMREASELFEKTEDRNYVSWNTMIAAYLHNGDPIAALCFFRKMLLEGVHPDKVSLAVALDICATLRNLSGGKLIHDIIMESALDDAEVSLGTALANMYGKCGSLENAKKSFDKIADCGTVSWNVMITAYAQNGHIDDAKNLLQNMPAADVVSSTVMIAAYAQNGNLHEARKLFDEMATRDVACWNAMVAAYAQNGQGREAVDLFRLMDMNGFYPDRITFVGILDACATLSSLAEGKTVHGIIIDSDLEADTIVGTALIDMYGRRGHVDDARKVFDLMVKPNIFSWTAMLTAYAQNGHSEEALDLFYAMNIRGVKPNEVTFVSILAACSHAGLVADGLQYFHSVLSDYSLCLIRDHYVCMVDLLGRAGQLNQAEELLNVMPFKPDCISWMALLSACRVHSSVDRAERAADKATSADPQNPAPFILLSNIYAAVGRLSDAARVRKTMELKGLNSKAGFSCLHRNS